MVTVLFAVACSEQHVATVPIIRASVDFLWNPNALEEDWQVLNQPRDLVQGVANDLFVTDSRNSRVVRFRSDGELIEIIGGKGGGPGEFELPMHLAYDSSESVLWVTDGFYGRISRFKVYPDRKTEFIDTYNCPQVKSVGNPTSGLALLQNGGFLYSSEPGISGIDYRIVVFDRSANVIDAFGELWVENDWTRPRILSMNKHVLESIDSRTIATIWQSQPLIEIWDTESQTVLERLGIEIFENIPEFKLLASLEVPENAHIQYFIGHGIDERRRVLIVGMGNILYEVSLQTMEVILRVDCSDENQKHRRFGKIVLLEASDTSQTAYAIDLGYSTVVRITYSLVPTNSSIPEGR